MAHCFVDDMAHGKPLWTIMSIKAMGAIGW